MLTGLQPRFIPNPSHEDSNPLTQAKIPNMLMGSSRPKTRIRRTSSMRGLDSPQPSSAMILNHHQQQPHFHQNQNNDHISGNMFDQSSNFLRTCGLCRRKLAAGRDLYMYMGNSAFCSQECREEQMKRDGNTSTAPATD